MVKNNNSGGNKMIINFLKDAAFTAFLLIFLLLPSLLFAFTNDDIYDAAGFDPHREGKGFNATATGNTVKFNGMHATVSV
jgi:hypothetical protein